MFDQEGPGKVQLKNKVSECLGLNLIETEANYSGDHVQSWLLLVRNVTVVTGGLLKLKARDQIQIFILQIHFSDNGRQNGRLGTDWNQAYHGCGTWEVVEMPTLGTVLVS